MFVNERKMNTGGMERALRLATGFYLLNRSVDDAGRPKALLESLMGADLLASGITGYCPLNALLGRDTHHRE